MILPTKNTTLWENSSYQFNTIWIEYYFLSVKKIHMVHKIKYSFAVELKADSKIRNQQKTNYYRKNIIWKIIIK